MWITNTSDFYPPSSILTALFNYIVKKGLFTKLTFNPYKVIKNADRAAGRK